MYIHVGQGNRLLSRLLGGPEIRNCNELVLPTLVVDLGTAKVMLLQVSVLLSPIPLKMGTIWCFFWTCFPSVTGTTVISTG